MDNLKMVEEKVKEQTQYRERVLKQRNELINNISQLQEQLRLVNTEVVRAEGRLEALDQIKVSFKENGKSKEMEKKE